MTSNLNARILKLWNLTVCCGFSYPLSITTQPLGGEGWSGRALLKAQISRIHDVTGIKNLLHPLQGHGIARSTLVDHRSQFAIGPRKERPLVEQGGSRFAVDE